MVHEDAHNPAEVSVGVAVLSDCRLYGSLFGVVRDWGTIMDYLRRKSQSADRTVRNFALQ
jgi:hypothetical protein